MDLFDYAWKRSKSEMMSDMKGQFRRQNIQLLFREIDVEQNSIKEWNEIIDYLLGEENFQPMKSMEDVRKFLKG